MYTITKEFHFSAAHVLIGLAEKHPCSRMHGHNYIVKVELSSKELNETSFVTDYGDLKPIREFIDSKLDHKFIASSEHQADDFELEHDEIFWLGKQSSAENLAKFLFDTFKKQFKNLSAIGVSETPKTWAWYRPVPKVEFTISGKDVEKFVIIKNQNISDAR